MSLPKRAVFINSTSKPIHKKTITYIVREGDDCLVLSEIAVLTHKHPDVEDDSGIVVEVMDEYFIREIKPQDQLYPAAYMHLQASRNLALLVNGK